ncbi:MAG: ROK family protein [Clostridia bacterium]|nr:ROK family protein [Clostridia bacterium]
MKLRIGMDLGGTTAKLGVVNEQNEIVERKVIPTEKGITFEETIAQLAEGILSMGDIGIVGFGVPSSLKPGTDVVIHANNLGWKNKDLRGELKKHLGTIPIYIANDADSAAVGEYFQGAGQGCQSMLMLTLGTGVGGGYIYQGRLYRGGNGCGFEPGHMIVQQDGIPCTCGMHGCLESYCSATGIIREITACKSSPALQELIADNGGKATARMLFDAVRAGDAAAKDILAQYVHTLAIGIGSLTTILRPEIVVIGGGVSGAGDLLFDPLREEVKRTTFSYDVIGGAAIIPAALGNDAGIIGAAMLDRVMI